MSKSPKRKVTKLERQVRIVLNLFQTDSEQHVDAIRAALNLRIADDHQPIMAAVIDSAPFPVIYVWERQGMWTCAPTAEIRMIDAYELAKQDATKWQRRLRRQLRFHRGEALTGELRAIANAAKATVETLADSLPDPDRHDPCLARIDRKFAADE